MLSANAAERKAECRRQTADSAYKEQRPVSVKKEASVEMEICAS